MILNKIIKDQIKAFQIYPYILLREPFSPLIVTYKFYFDI